jgi:hypothetical protein
VLERTTFNPHLQEDGEAGGEAKDNGSESVAGLERQHRASSAVLVLRVFILGGAESRLKSLSRQGRGRRRNLGAAGLLGAGLIILLEWVSLSTAWLVLSALLSAKSISFTVVYASLDNVAAGEVWDGLRVQRQIWGLAITTDTSVVEVLWVAFVGCGGGFTIATEKGAGRNLLVAPEILQRVTN